MIPFDQAIETLPQELRSTLAQAAFGVKESVNEIRIRVGKPLVLICRGNRVLFVEPDGRTSLSPLKAFTATHRLLEETVRSMSGYSLHSVQNSLFDGFLTLPGGHRAGFSGNVAWEGDKITAVRRTDCLNVRIARQVTGAADILCGFYRKNGVRGTLIVGPPSSGKTTVLKDLCRQLSSGTVQECCKVSLIDERGEIAAVYQGQPQNDIGWNTDVFDGYSKRIGIDIAIRCMSPDVIICDEIGGKGDEENVLSGVNAGVSMIATAHAATYEELFRRKNMKAVLESGAFQYLVLLDKAGNPGVVKEIVRYGEICRALASFSNLRDGGTSFSRPLEATGQRA